MSLLKRAVSALWGGGEGDIRIKKEKYKAYNVILYACKTIDKINYNEIIINTTTTTTTSIISPSTSQKQQQQSTPVEIFDIQKYPPLEESLSFTNEQVEILTTLNYYIWSHIQHYTFAKEIDHIIKMKRIGENISDQIMCDVILSEDKCFHKLSWMGIAQFFAFSVHYISYSIKNNIPDKEDVMNDIKYYINRIILPYVEKYDEKLSGKKNLKKMANDIVRMDYVSLSNTRLSSLLSDYEEEEEEEEEEDDDGIKAYNILSCICKKLITIDYSIIIQKKQLFVNELMNDYHYDQLSAAERDILAKLNSYVITTINRDKEIYVSLIQKSNNYNLLLATVDISTWECLQHFSYINCEQ